MTNEEIIADVATSIYGEDAVMDMLEKGLEIPLHTLQGWASRGFKIKKGAHAVAETKLWKKRKKKSNGEIEKLESEEQTDQIPTDRDFYMCRAFLFSYEQVEKKIHSS